MIAIDTQLLVYAHRPESPFHEPAFALVRQLAEGPASWALPWPCVHEYYSVVTHPRIYAPPTPPTMAIDQIAAWLESPTLHLLAETRDHWSHLSGLLSGGKIAGPRVHDARIAALCLAHGVTTLWSADRDLSRFPSLQVVNPLVDGL